jgi:hypothetical protein
MAASRQVQRSGVYVSEGATMAIDKHTESRQGIMRHGLRAALSLRDRASARRRKPDQRVTSQPSFLYSNFHQEHRSLLTRFADEFKLPIGLAAWLVTLLPNFIAVPLINRYEVWAVFAGLIIFACIEHFTTGVRSAALAAVICLIPVVVVLVVRSSNGHDPNAGASSNPPALLNTIEVSRAPSLIVRAFGFWYVLHPNTARIDRLDDDNELNASFKHLTGPARDMIACGNAIYVTHMRGKIARVARVNPISGAVERDYPYGRGLGDLACGRGAVWVSDPKAQAVFRLRHRNLAYLLGVTLDSRATSLAYGRGVLWILEGTEDELIGVSDRDRRRGPYAVAPGAVQILYLRPYVWILHAARACVEKFDLGQEAEVPPGVPIGPTPGRMSASDGRIYVPSLAAGSVVTIDGISREAAGPPIVLGPRHKRLTDVGEFDRLLVLVDGNRNESILLTQQAQTKLTARRPYRPTSACR